MFEFYFIMGLLHIYCGLEGTKSVAVVSRRLPLRCDRLDYCYMYADNRAV